MLSLDDVQWEVLTAHGHAGDLPGLLRTLHRATTPEQAAALTHAITEYVCYEYDVYTASYAALPHLVEAAAGQPSGERAYLLGLIGRIAALAQRHTAAPVPPELQPDYEAALRRTADVALDGLAQPSTAGDLRLLCGALAAVRGHPVLALDLLETVANPAALQCPECERFHPSFGYALVHDTDQPTP
jgi:hypothetical protein